MSNYDIMYAQTTKKVEEHYSTCFILFGKIEAKKETLKYLKALKKNKEVNRMIFEDLYDVIVRW